MAKELEGISEGRIAAIPNVIEQQHSKVKEQETDQARDACEPEPLHARERGTAGASPLRRLPGLLTRSAWTWPTTWARSSVSTWACG